jgi:hypothetical protein
MMSAPNMAGITSASWENVSCSRSTNVRGWESVNWGTGEIYDVQSPKFKVQNPKVGLGCGRWDWLWPTSSECPSSCRTAHSDGRTDRSAIPAGGRSPVRRSRRQGPWLSASGCTAGMPVFPRAARLRGSPVLRQPNTDWRRSRSLAAFEEGADVVRYRDRLSRHVVVIDLHRAPFRDHSAIADVRDPELPRP